jgi:hypothetical protein
MFPGRLRLMTSAADSMHKTRNDGELGKEENQEVKATMQVNQTESICTRFGLDLMTLRSVKS